MDVTLATLEQTDSVLAIGAIAVSQLRENRQVTFFVNSQGGVEIADPKGVMCEAALDALPEETAIQELLRRDYDDERLVVYLKGREARKKT